jgi:uncharacterized membrane protein YhaH (DUF805 family)
MRQGLRKGAVFKGRACRSEYVWLELLAWSPMLIFAGLMQVSSALPQWFGAVFLILVLMSALMIIPAWAAAVRRLHDLGVTGWLLLLASIVGLGPVLVVVLAFLPGNAGANRYGPDPRQRVIADQPAAGGTP